MLGSQTFQSIVSAYKEAHDSVEKLNNERKRRREEAAGGTDEMSATEKESKEMETKKKLDSERVAAMIDQLKAIKEASLSQMASNKDSEAKARRDKENKDIARPDSFAAMMARMPSSGDSGSPTRSPSATAREEEAVATAATAHVSPSACAVSNRLTRRRASTSTSTHQHHQPAPAAAAAVDVKRFVRVSRERPCRPRERSEEKNRDFIGSSNFSTGRRAAYRRYGKKGEISDTTR